MKYLTVVVMALISLNANAEPVGDCKGTPSSAVTSLPEPLNKWGQIVCTPYGHIITNKEGWIWSNPGSYSPVMIPSQIVRDNPEPLANESYFTKIEMSEVSGKEAQESVNLFEKGFDTSESMPSVYSLNVTSSSGKSLDFKFFDYGNSQWGMWCNKECDPNSKFMLLNMAKEPNQ
ncbi:hypothetical protein OOT55_14290 [Marinimicrobium sp. C6131]|uniref:hypothetical protein n=1 Tax=Marinimicrobium sp. C6131 TaxID=3022676 RepID=UPI00223C9E57|nr:hypothetical protein [Marinimicrobium sp. C6131]UZJ43817.1 hypothetical protein OOT55_14290 [Marinimicrobium sp. C6131]